MDWVYIHFYIYGDSCTIILVLNIPCISFYIYKGDSHEDNPLLVLRATPCILIQNRPV